MANESARRGFVSFTNGVRSVRDLAVAHFFGYKVNDEVSLGFALDEGFERISGFTSGRAASIKVVKKDKSGLHIIKAFSYGKDGKSEFSTFEKALDSAKRFATTYLTTNL